MKSQISRWGNSLGLRIPKHIAEGLGLSANDEVECRIEQGQLMVKPIKPIQKLPKYTLAELLSQDLEPESEIDWGSPQGGEEW
jgi:antitoxin MazE